MKQLKTFSQYKSSD